MRDGWPPRWLTKVPAADVRRGDGEDFSGFIEATCRVTKSSVAASRGELIRLRPWQRKLTGHVFARRPDGRYRHRTALVGMARKNGKSALGAGYALAGLLLGEPGAEVYSCAGDREQASIVFNAAREMVELDPELSSVLKVYKHSIVCPSTGSLYKALSAEAFTKEGLNPTLVVFDEVHVQPSRELWDVMALAMGARIEPLMLGITTAGAKTDRNGQDSLCYQLYQYGQKIATGEVDDPTFFMSWWEPPSLDDPYDDPKTWRGGNPGYGDIVSEEDFLSKVRGTLEPEWRTKRCNQWVNRLNPWLPGGAWEKRSDEREIPDGADVVLAFDGSYSGDSTGLVAVEIGDTPHVDVVASWEKSPADPIDWTVDVDGVERAIRSACEKWNVREIACDTARWSRSFQILEFEGLPVVEFPQSPSRMIPATSQAYEAVMNETMTHSGDPRLARHVGNAQTRISGRGVQLTKDTASSGRKIDLAVCMVMGLARAQWWATRPAELGPLIF